MATGIKDKVAILGMGCSKFGERWDASPEDLMLEAYNEAMADAGITPQQLGAAWYSTHMDDVGTGRGGTPMSIALRLPNIGVTDSPPSKCPDDALLLGVASLSPTIEFSGEYRPVWQVPIKAMMIQDAPPDFAHVEATGLLRREGECDAAQKLLRFLATVSRGG